MIGHLILRLTIWFLLTSDLSVENIIIGLLIAVIIPRSYTPSARLKDWLSVLRKILIAIPTAYLEAFEIIIRPHQREDIIREGVQLKRSRILIFMDVFLITFTPKTIVIRYNQEGYYEVHRILPGNKP